MSSQSPENKPSLVSKLFERENIEQVHTTARELRDRSLDILDFGVISSTSEVPNKHDSKATKLPYLLRYSPIINSHMNNLRRILSSPREFQIVDKPGQAWRSDLPDGDVIYRRERKNHVYYFTHDLSSEDLNPFLAAFNSLKENDPFLCVSIVKINEGTHKHLWDLGYFFSIHDETSNINIKASNLSPERDMVLNFWFSPRRMDGEEIFKKFPTCEFVKGYLTFVGTEDIQGFRHHIIHYNALGQAEVEEKSNYIYDLAYQYSSYLRRKGNLQFSIVEIGKIKLHSQSYWVYTGSEQSGLEQKEASWEHGRIRQFKPIYTHQ